MWSDDIIRHLCAHMGGKLNFLKVIKKNFKKNQKNEQNTDIISSGAALQSHPN